MNQQAKTMSWRLAGSLSVSVHGTQPPTDAEWAAFMQQFERIPNLERVRSFVFSLGGGPNVQQRAALSRALAGTSPRAVIVTPSPLMRTIGTAISWFNRNLLVCNVEDMDRAIAHLQLDLDGERTLRRLLIETAADVGVKLPPSRPQAAR